MIDYTPLFKIMKERNLTQTDILRRCEIHYETFQKMTRNESVTLSTIEKICNYLQVPIEEVVRIDYKK